MEDLGDGEISDKREHCSEQPLGSPPTFRSNGCVVREVTHGVEFGIWPAIGVSREIGSDMRPTCDQVQIRSKRSPMASMGD